MVGRCTCGLGRCIVRRSTGRSRKRQPSVLYEAYECRLLRLYYPYKYGSNHKRREESVVVAGSRREKTSPSSIIITRRFDAWMTPATMLTFLLTPSIALSRVRTVARETQTAQLILDSSDCCVINSDSINPISEHFRQSEILPARPRTTCVDHEDQSSHHKSPVCCRLDLSLTVLAILLPCLVVTASQSVKGLLEGL